MADLIVAGVILAAAGAAYTSIRNRKKQGGGCLGCASRGMCMSQAEGREGCGGCSAYRK